MIAFIDDHRGAYGVEPICKVLPIAPSTYRAHAAKRADPAKLSARAKQDAIRKIEIRRVFAENFDDYVVRKVWRQLRRRARVKNGPALAGHGAEAVRDAITRTIVTLSEQLRRSLTWDQGAEMAQHARLKIEAGVRVYFCDPHSPWQRGTNENTNGLLRQYFPKGTDLSMHSANEIAAVAAALNSRPRKTLDWKTPAEALDRFLLSADKDRVATTA